MELYFVFGVLLFVIVAITLTSGVYLFRIKLSSAAKELAVLCFAATLYCIFFALELASNNFEMKFIFSMTKHTAVPFFAPLWLIFILRLFKKQPKHIILFYVVLFAVPTICLLLRVTNSFHGLYYSSISIIEHASFQVLVFTWGFWIYVFAAYISIVFTAILVIVVAEIIKSKKNRYQAIILLGTMLVLILIGFADATKIWRFAIIILPFVLPASVIFIFLKLFKFNLFKMVPLSHTKIFEWSEIGIFILDNDFKLTDYNTAVTKIFPQIKQIMYGKDFNAFMKEAHNFEETVINSKEHTIAIKIDETVSHYNINSTALFDKKHKKTGYMVTFANITKIVDIMDQLTYQAATDYLTGLYTRRSFSQNAENELSRARMHDLPLSFIMLDIDHFKNTNDTFGHAAGDEVLKNVAKICRRNLRDVDLLGRFGGDEFIVLLPGVNLDGANIVAERIREAIEEYIVSFEENDIKSKVSIGIAGVDKVGDEDFDYFMRSADKALYFAKMQGRNRVMSFADTK